MCTAVGTLGPGKPLEGQTKGCPSVPMRVYSCSIPNQGTGCSPCPLSVYRCALNWSLQAFGCTWRLHRTPAVGSLWKGSQNMAAGTRYMSLLDPSDWKVLEPSEFHSGDSSTHLGSESKVRVLQCSPSPVPLIQMYIAWTSRPEVGPCTPAWCLCSSGSSPRWPWWKVFWAPSKAAGRAGGKSEVRRSEDGEALLRQPALLPFLALSSCNFNSCVSLAVYSNSGHLSVLCNCVATPLPCEGFTTGDKVKWKDQPWAHHWPYSSLVSLCIFNLNTHCHYKNESGRVNTC